MTPLIAAIVYALIAVATKSYYNVYRHTDSLSPEEPYLIGILWPFYVIYRLLAFPFMTGSSYLEKKILEFREKEKTRVHVHPSELSDSDYEEAEREVESLLDQQRERSNYQ